MRAKAEVGGGARGHALAKGGINKTSSDSPWQMGGEWVWGGGENDREEGEKGVELRGWTDDKDVGGGGCRGGLR